jgi:hypothetical protein
MAKCARCGDETDLYIGEIPVCLKCEEELRPEPEREPRILPAKPSPPREKTG